MFFRPGVGTIRAMGKTFVVVVGLVILLHPRGGSDRGARTRLADPTFSKDVAPILYKNCVSCHRPGEIGRMPLLTYEQTRPYAKAIANAVTNRTMPPWHAEAPAGTFHNERILSDAERETLTRGPRAGRSTATQRFAGAADVQRRMGARKT